MNTYYSSNILFAVCLGRKLFWTENDTVEFRRPGDDAPDDDPRFGWSVFVPIQAILSNRQQFNCVCS